MHPVDFPTAPQVDTLLSWTSTLTAWHSVCHVLANQHNLMPLMLHAMKGHTIPEDPAPQSDALSMIIATNSDVSDKKNRGQNFHRSRDVSERTRSRVQKNMSMNTSTETHVQEHRFWNSETQFQKHNSRNTDSEFHKSWRNTQCNICKSEDVYITQWNTWVQHQNLQTGTTTSFSSWNLSKR